MADDAAHGARCFTINQAWVLARRSGPRARCAVRAEAESRAEIRQLFRLRTAPILLKVAVPRAYTAASCGAAMQAAVRQGASLAARPRPAA